MNILDIIIAIPLLWALYRGFRKGLVYLIASIAALFLGILGAVRFHEACGGLLNRWFEIDPDHLKILAFAVTFILIVIIVHAAAFLLDKLIKAVALNFVNRLAGMVFGVLITAFMISVVLQPVVAANSQKEFISKDTIEGSLFFEPFSKLAPAVFPYLKRAEFRKWIPGYKQDEELRNSEYKI
jgi:membrane protein required for colicin V production